MRGDIELALRRIGQRCPRQPRVLRHEGDARLGMTPALVRRHRQVRADAIAPAIIAGTISTAASRFCIIAPLSVSCA
ncbi:hypothetical protein MOP88_16700 [Sphingomonas sp. WKB10]|nr:hypothetical protein [Sphingomonas sp. WKB10]